MLNFLFEIVLSGIIGEQKAPLVAIQKRMIWFNRFMTVAWISAYAAMFVVFMAISPEDRRDNLIDGSPGVGGKLLIAHFALFIIHANYVPYVSIYFFFRSIGILQNAVDANPTAVSSKPLLNLIKQLKDLRKAAYSLIPQALFANCIIVGWPYLRAKVRECCG